MQMTIKDLLSEYYYILFKFLNVRNQFQEPLMQNFVFFGVRRMVYPNNLAQKITFHSSSTSTVGKFVAIK